MSSPEKLFRCFQEARRSQAQYSKCLQDICSDGEEKLFQELAMDAAKQVKKIKDFYRTYYGTNLTSCHCRKERGDLSKKFFGGIAKW
ncbi:hypothetical protein P4S93_13545 [Aneurinibacillus thermoaerophilus]|uniref:Coat F domain-containing protein n=2 Tax=Aneurinibacillus thermoaerophilus TaxID=143495 RepID=A0ABX8YGA1_ANETH|nr:MULTISPECIES: hypothetical protein [Aneurinibacillus]MED0678491.1 hypothetical protein [Aneurinibacillus thermoaerophilus]MED0759075.1 hypothetical protein [Aneurinibacillus thermoaerophilus]MED0761786.1 hypothetical protein [Aneurinibacillus thermoaerophilus]MED0763018.1 hypothetical protein [Aneurinibacillus thermoaerophilus]QYY44335.1 hypothetical protein K3F53_09285 [Aneurinibacillus thermoaerophilus]